MGGRVIQGVCFEKLVRGKEGKVKILYAAGSVIFR